MTRPLTLADVARYPLPGTAVPTAVRFSCDGSFVAYLASGDGTLAQSLFLLEVATGATKVLLDPAGGGVRDETVSHEEALRRERLRERGQGVTSYAWAENAPRILVPFAGRLVVLDPAAERRIDVDVGAGAPPVDPRMSPCGKFVAYVQDAELHVSPVEGGAPRQVTSGARGTGRTHGLAEYVAQEEMARHEGFWWSPDSRFLAFTEVDDTHVPVYRIVHQGKDSPLVHEDHRYPFAGAENARVRLGVVSADGGDPVWMDLGDAEYLARVTWFPDGSLVAQLQDRLQSELRVVRFDAKTGLGTTLVTECSDVWINLHGMLRPLKKAKGEAAGGFVWASERTGFMHLYLCARDGRVIRPLTAGAWQVDAMGGVDEERGLVHFHATKDGPTERHLYTVPLAGGAAAGEARRATQDRGIHDGAVDAAHGAFVDAHHSAIRPPTVAIRSLTDGAALARLPVRPDPRVAELGLEPPQLVTLRSSDGAELHGAIYAPSPQAGRAPHPLIVSVYGGPHAQRVTDGWGMTVDLRAQFLRARGFLVFVLDNRGSARRGLAFEGAIRHDMGNVEVRDQVDGVRHLVDLGLADAARVGIYGWSYGGYMALMALARAPETFRAAVAGAPVTHYDGYDTHYTERYMGLPRDNAEGYRRSSVMAHVSSIRGELMIVHGMLDENVHFRHTARLVDALHRARKSHELLVLPNERHMPRDEAGRAYVEERVVSFFERTLR